MMEKDKEPDNDPKNNTLSLHLLKASTIVKKETCIRIVEDTSSCHPTESPIETSSVNQSNSNVKVEVLDDASFLEDEGGVGTRCSDTTACTKQELDIGPTKLQPPDMFFMLQSCKPDPDYDEPLNAMPRCTTMKRGLRPGQEMRNMESFKSRRRSLTDLLNDIRLDVRKREICALCLCQESLYGLSHSITLDIKPARNITISELIDAFELVQICGGLPSEKICSVCVDHMKTYYEFTNNCLEVSSAFKNFLNTVNAEGTERKDKSRKDTSKFVHNDILGYADINVIKERNDQYSNYAEGIFGKDPKSVISKDSKMDIIDNLREQPTDKAVSQYGISSISGNGYCNVCHVDNMSWVELTEHTKIHLHENVLKRIVKSQPFCGCCLRPTDDLVDVSQKVTVVSSQMPEQSLRLDTMLREVFHTEDLNRYKPALICENCISKGIEAHSFQQMYQQSTATLQNCMTRLDHGLNSVFKVNKTIQAKVNVIVKVDFQSRTSNTIENESDSTWDPPSEPNEAASEITNGGTVIKNKKTKIYECTKCEKDFSLKYKYMEHRKVNTRRECHSCRICKQKFKSETLLHNHKETHRDRINCIVCRRMYSILEINSHMEQQHSKQKQICNECKQCFYRKHDLKKHIIAQHTIPGNDGPNTCQLCYKEFKTQLQYKMHKCRHLCKQCADYPCVHEAYLKVFRNEEREAPKSIHKCMDCDYSYVLMWNLLDHVNKEHLLLFPHICSDCGEHFPSKRALCQHIAYEHKETKILCPHCRNNFRSTVEMEKHAEECKTLDKPYSCEVCNTCFATHDELTEHFVKHMPKTFQCSICTVKFHSQEKLDTHTYKVHEAEPIRQKPSRYKTGRIKPSKYQCSMCMMEFTSLKERLEHEMTHPPDTEHQCHICRRTFQTRIARFAHVRTHKPHLDKPCEICGKLFDENSLHKHMTVHAKEKTDAVNPKMVKPKGFMCDVCGALKANCQALNRHKEVHKNQQKCPHCSESISKRSFDKHMEHHKTGDDGCLKTYIVRGKVRRHFRKKLECDKCDYSTLFEQCYEAHLNKHMDIKPYVCKICEKAFYGKVTLMQHVKTHEGLKPEQCEQCDKRFKSKKALTFHLRLHTGERPFPCEFCELSFISANRMKEHQIRNHFKPQFPCEMCGKMFFAKRFVQKHIKEVHLGEKKVQPRGKKKA